MTDPVADAARSAAAILAPELGVSLPSQVEAVLATRRTSNRQGQYTFDPVSVASLIVSIATLAWTIYNDLHERTHETPKPETIARRVHITFRDQETSLPHSAEHITEVVATEIIRHAEPDD